MFQSARLADSCLDSCSQSSAVDCRQGNCRQSWSCKPGFRDRLIFGNHDAKVRERLLRETNLTLKTDEICRAAESMTEQMRIVGQSNDATTSVHAVRPFSGQKKRMNKEASRSTKSETAKECWNCGRQHGRQPKELCPAIGKSCDFCGKQNHFANKCRQKRSGSTHNSVRAIGEPDEVFAVCEGATL